MRNRHSGRALRALRRAPLSAVVLAVASALALAAQPVGHGTPLPPATANGIFLPGGPSSSRPATDEILVKFRSRADADEVEREGSVAANRRPGLAAVLERHGIRGRRRPFARVGYRRLDRVVTVVSERARRDPRRFPEVLASLRARPEVEYAEPNVTLQAFWAPDDPYFNSSGAWGQAFGDLWGLHKIGAASAWDRSRGAGVVVAVLDTGIDFTHAELSPSVWQNPGETGLDGFGRDKRTNGVDDDGNGFVDDWRGWDFTWPGAGYNDPTDYHGHGTHVAGTIAAVGNNAAGVIGVAPLATVMAVRVLNAYGSGTLEAISNGILYAANAGARVINASLGGTGDTPQTLIDAIAYAHDVKGVVFVAAAGNSNADVGRPWKGTFPANIRNTLAVAAFNHVDQRASFSNFGSKIDVAAPGGGDTDATGTLYEPQRSILSLRAARAGGSITGNGQLVVNGQFLRQAGTSMAAPHVAGLAALILAQHPTYSPEQVRQAIRRGADDLGSVGFDPQSGYGRINADRGTSEPPALAAQLTDPAQAFAALTPASIHGSVGGPNLLDWTLEYGVGSSPSDWYPLSSGSAGVTNGVLGSWPPDTPDGAYTLRLRAGNAGGLYYTDRLEVLVDSLSITSPSPTAELAVAAGTPVAVHGTVAPAGFSSYSMTVTGARGGPLLAAPIELANGGGQPVVGGLLGTWDTTGAPADHYQICVRLDSSPFTSECTQVLVDPALRPGWPRGLGLMGSGGLTYAIVDHLTAADVDGDGALDLPVAYGGVVHVLGADGDDVVGWPQTIDPQASGDITQFGPAIGDVTGDGIPEVVAVTNRGYVFVWQADGVLVPGWPRRLVSFFGRLAVDDLDGDGRKEIIVASGSIAVVDANGVPRPGWPKTPGPTSFNGLAIGDVDGDGKRELVVEGLSGPSPIYVYRADGTLVPGWPQNLNPGLGTSYQAHSAPVLGDLNGDGAAEIVAGSYDGKLFAFRGDGSQLPGWPQLAKPRPVNSPAIGDIDGDGRPEVVAGTEYFYESQPPYAYGDYLFAWHGDGTLLPGWPVRVHSGISYTSFGFGAPTLADVDGDGKADVVASSDVNGYAPFALHAYRFDGTRVGDFPRPTLSLGAYPTNAAAFADLDGDGLSEMAWIDGDSNLYLWELGAPAAGAQPWPMFGHDPAHTRRAAPAQLRLNLRLGGVGGALGSVSVSPSGARCDKLGVPDEICVYAFAAGTPLTLTALPEPGGSVTWGGACSGSGETCEVVLTDDRSVTATFRPANLAPTAAPGGPYTGYRNQAIGFDGSASSDPDGDALTYEWDFGDGSTATGVSPAHAYASLGSYTVTLVVSDGALSSPAATTSVAILNRAPIANAGGPYAGNNATALTIGFDGTGSSDPDGDPLTYAWTFGDGTPGNGPTPSHSYAGSGYYPVTLTVSDGIASSAPAGSYVTIADVIPPAPVTDLAASAVGSQSVTLRWTATGNNGSSGTAAMYDLRYSKTPIDAASFPTATMAVGEPTPKPAGSQEVFTVPSLTPGTAYYFALKVFDAADNASGLSNLASAATTPLVTIWSDDLEAGAGQWTVSGSSGSAPLWHLSTRRSSSPTTSFYYGSEATRNYDTGVRNSGSITSVPIDLAGAQGSRLSFKYFLQKESSPNYDLARVLISANAGAAWTPLGGALTNVGSMTPVVLDLRAYDGQLIRLRFDFDTVDSVANNYEGWYVDDIAVTADARVPVPTAQPGGPYAGFKRQPIAFDGSASTSPSGAPLTYAWSFGDGTTGSGARPAHAYGSAGTFTVTLVVSDGTTSSRPATTAATVTNRAPTAVVGGPYAGVEGAAPVAFDGTGSFDPDGDPLSYSWIFGDGSSGGGPAPAHVYTRGGSLSVALTVSDGTTSSPVSTTTATITPVPPAAVADLSATPTSARSVRLNWTATGDDGSQGTATSYDLRYATTPIDPVSFESATPVTGEPAPRVAGSAETMNVTGLTPDTLYYFALKVVDESGPPSPLSNAASARTPGEQVSFSDDLESGLVNWTIAGSNGTGGPALWHLGSHRYYSPTRALYYGLEPGHTYSTGGRNFGSATSRSISLAGVTAPRLSFRHYLQKEGSSAYDVARVMISTNGASWTQLAAFSSTASITLVDLDLAAYQNQAIQIRFDFDTIDAYLNGYEGWVVDDVRVLGSVN